MLDDSQNNCKQLRPDLRVPVGLQISSRSWGTGGLLKEHRVAEGSTQEQVIISCNCLHEKCVLIDFQQQLSVIYLSRLPNNVECD